MENNNELNDLLKQKMSLDELGINEPELSLVEEARKKVLFRKKPENKSVGVLEALSYILNFRIKLYQAGIATVLIAAALFFAGRNSGDNSETKTLQYADVDSLKSSSVKDNMMLVKNFTSRIN